MVDKLPPGGTQAPPKSEADRIIGLLGGLDLHSESRHKPIKNTIVAGIQIHRGGILVPQSTILTYNTRSELSSFDSLDSCCGLFLSQTPTHKIARHSRGTFNSVEEHRLDSMRDEEEKYQEGLIKLEATLGEILKLVRNASPVRMFSLVYENGGLGLWTREGKLLPKELRGYFKN